MDKPLSSRILPNIWNQGLITPIHKSGDKFDPNNYCGICVNSNLGKILCIIINSRLLHFLSENNVLSKCQIGFEPNYHMTDHVFTLHTLIDKQTNQNKGNVTLILFIWRGVREIGPICSVWSVHNVTLFARTLNYKISKWKNATNETVPCGTNTDMEQTITHNSKVKPGYLSMVLNQGQRLTAASDWEPYQAKHRNPKS